jgi:hypothetical protein
MVQPQGWGPLKLFLENLLDQYALRKHGHSPGTVILSSPGDCDVPATSLGPLADFKR